MEQERLHWGHLGGQELWRLGHVDLPAELPGKPHGGPAAAAKSLQLYPTLCDPIDGSPPGSPVPGILQARTLESKGKARAELRPARRQAREMIQMEQERLHWGHLGGQELWRLGHVDRNCQSLPQAELFVRQRERPGLHSQAVEPH